MCSPADQLSAFLLLFPLFASPIEWMKGLGVEIYEFKIIMYMGTAPLFLHPIFCQTKSRLATSLPLILTLILRIKMTVSSQQAASWWMAASEGRENMHMQVSLSLLNSSDKAWTWRSCGSICVNSITEPTALKSLWINLWQCINQTWSQKVLNKSTPAPPSSGVFLGCVRSGEVGGPLRQ